jgi:hypothetical protein
MAKGTETGGQAGSSQLEVSGSPSPGQRALFSSCNKPFFSLLPWLPHELSCSVRTAPRESVNEQAVLEISFSRPRAHTIFDPSKREASTKLIFFFVD